MADHEEDGRGIDAPPREFPLPAAILDALPFGLMTVDRRGCISWANRCLAGYLERPLDELLRRPYWHTLYEPAFGDWLDEVREAGGPLTVTTQLHRGSPRRFQLTFLTHHPPDVHVVVEDITRLNQLERIRTDFVANIAHELKTPVTSVLGYVETLLERERYEPEQLSQFLSTIRNEARRMDEMVQELLALARLEAEESVQEPRVVDLGELLEKIHASMVDQAEIKELALTYNPPREGRTLAVLGSYEDLYRALVNLVDNALKYTPAGGSIDLDLRQDGTYAVVTVADTGVGIPEEHQDRIFERFYRVDQTRARARGGTGLGLAIVKHVVNNHQGSILVESRPGEGATFTVRLPLHLAGGSGEQPAGGDPS